MARNHPPAAAFPDKRVGELKFRFERFTVICSFDDGLSGDDGGVSIKPRFHIDVLENLIFSLAAAEVVYFVGESGHGAIRTCQRKISGHVTLQPFGVACLECFAKLVDRT